MQTDVDSLLPDQKVKIAREDATLQKLRTLEQQYPDEAASFAVLMSKPKKTAPAPTTSAGTVEKVEALALCSCPTHTPSLPVGVCSSAWIECHTPDGHKFFHDVFTKTSCWELPSPPPPVASIPLPPFPPADSEDDDSEDDPWISRENMWEHERLERAACAVCVSNVYGTVCSGCSRCLSHCAGLSYCD